MKPIIQINIRGELGYYIASAKVNGVYIETPSRIALSTALNTLGTMLQQKQGIRLTDHPFTINYMPEVMPGIDGL